MKNKIRWGIIGTGGIAESFASDLKVLDDATLIAVSSRTQESADQFAVPHRHVGREALAQDPDVDAVYVATLNPIHKDDTIACLNAGKAVLCEKPFAMNQGEVNEMIATARRKGVFLMEAMWMYCLPAMAKLREIITSGAIGEVRLLQSNFCYRTGRGPTGRALAPELGGGALLDVGVYEIALAQMIFQQEPTRINSMAHLGATGVDEQSAMILGYQNGALAVNTCAVCTGGPSNVGIYGTEGHITIPDSFWAPSRIILNTDQGDPQEFTFEYKGRGFYYQAAEVARCLRNGDFQSSIIPHSASIAIMKTMDKIRQQWPLVYPMEKQ